MLSTVYERRRGNTEDNSLNVQSECAILDYSSKGGLSGGQKIHRKGRSIPTEIKVSEE